jgi:hypothetical protein
MEATTCQAVRRRSATNWVDSKRVVDRARRLLSAGAIKEIREGTPLGPFWIFQRAPSHATSFDCVGAQKGTGGRQYRPLSLGQPHVCAVA